MRPVIFPYGPSNGARTLATALNTRRVRRQGTYRPRRDDVVVNWGNGDLPPWALPGTRWLNQPHVATIAQNKLSTFQKFREHNVPHPQWTTSRAEAVAMFTHRDSKVVCRTLLRASEGRGIVVARSAEELVAAPLYVKFWPKETEYRVHVFNGEVIDVAQKRLRNGARNQEGRNPYIRNTANGWVYTHENVNISGRARELACDAVRSVGLTFGAVDLAVNQRGDICVFEINTAPGLENTATINAYRDAIRRYCNQ